MKTSILIIMAWLCLIPAKAQLKTEKNISFKGRDVLELNIQIADSIKIHTWAKDEVLVKSSVNVNNNKDNDAYEITYSDGDNNVEVKAGFKKDYFRGKNNCCNETDIFWDVWMPDNKYLIVETINADITITGNTGRLKVKTISGYIDLSEPGGKNADIDFSTISGTIYSNHTLNTVREHSGLPVRIADRLNNGGAMIKLETISGDIFFRKTD